MSRQAIRPVVLIYLLVGSGLLFYGQPSDYNSPTGKNSFDDTHYQLKILSWNIGMLPIVDLIKSQDGRSQAIAKALYPCDYDIIVFQEAFTSMARSIIGYTLHKLYPYSYGPVNGSKFSLRFNSGLWILSKIPLIKLKEITFTCSAGFDSFARKGAAMFEGSLPNNDFQLVITHLEDDDYPQSIRDEQLREMYSKLILPYSDPSIPQIICGDFNTDGHCQEAYSGMLGNLNAEDGAISGDVKITFDDLSNDVYRSVHPNPRIIDYILTRNSQFISWIHREIKVLKSRWGQNYEYLSDHHAMGAVIEFRHSDNLTKLHILN